MRWHKEGIHDREGVDISPLFSCKMKTERKSKIYNVKDEFQKTSRRRKNG
jgi:hypothetical protein